MNKNALVVLFLLFAGFAAWFAWRGSDVAPDPMAPSAPGADSGVGAATAATAGAAAEVVTGNVDPAAGKGAGEPQRSAAVVDGGSPSARASVIRGRLVDARGAVRAGVELALSSWPIPQDTAFEDLPMPVVGMEDRKMPEVVTKADGTFQFELGANRRGSLELTDSELVFPDDGPRLDGRKGDQDLGDVVALRSGALQGVVQDEHGRPVAGVKVSAALGVMGFGTESQTATDDKGAFAVGKLHGGAWTLRTASDKFQPTVQQVTLKAEERRLDVVIVVRPGQAISGQVVDDLGRPVAGCKVGSKRREARGGMDIERFAADEATTTDASGFFTLSGLSDAMVTVRAFQKGYANAVAKDVPVGTGNLLLHVSRLGAIRGVLHAEDGTPIAGSMVRAMPAGQPGGDLRFGLADFDLFEVGESAVTQTAADGSFHLDKVKPGAMAVVAEGKTHRPARQGPLAIEPGRVVEGVRLVANAGATARVEVVDAEGKPVVGATVRVERPVAPGTEPGEFGSARATRVEVEAVEGEADTVFFGDDRPLGTAVTDERGLAVIPGLPQMRAVVRAQHAAHADAMPFEVALPKAGAVDVKLQMRTPGFAEVQVRTTDGAAVPGCGLAVKGGGKTIKATTDANGLARVGPLVAGDYTAFLTRDPAMGRAGGAFFVMGDEGEGLAGTRQACAVTAGETTRIEIVRPVLTRLHGVVSGPDGPVEGVVVELEKGEEDIGLPGFGPQARTGADGAYELRDVESGKYTLRYGKEAQMVKASAGVEVPVNTAELRQDLALRTGKLRVLVGVKGKGDPVAGASVELVRASSNAGEAAGPRRAVMVGLTMAGEDGAATSMTIGTPRTVTGADGIAEIDDIPVGTYTVEISHDRFAPAKVTNQQVVERQVTDSGRADLEAAGKIRGKVLQGDGTVAPIALVQCRLFEEKEWGQPEVAQGGEFEFAARKAGRHVLRARPLLGPGGPVTAGPEVEVTVAAGETATAEVRLPAK